MCIAIAKLPGGFLSKETLETCFDNNPDGCGFAYINRGGVIVINKSLEFDKFYKDYERATRANPESPFLIHFRIKTHGQVDIANCHPFQVDADRVFIHNGTIRGVPIDKDKSDTRMFNETILQKLPKDWEDSVGVQRLVEHMIDWSKIILLHRHKGVYIFNESKGHWDKDNLIWYSNDTYKERWSYYSKKSYPYQKDKDNKALIGFDSTKNTSSKDKDKVIDITKRVNGTVADIALYSNGWKHEDILSKLPKRHPYSTPSTYIKRRCAMCGTLRPEADMWCDAQRPIHELYCRDCLVELIDAGIDIIELWDMGTDYTYCTDCQTILDKDGTCLCDKLKKHKQVIDV